MLQYDYDNYVGFKDRNKDFSILRDVRKVQRTETLFLGTNHSQGRYEPLYTLTEQERDGLPSAYLIYMHSIDEADAALKIVGTMRHWKKLCSLKWFMEGVPQVGSTGLKNWREDMILRDVTLAKGVLLSKAKKGDVTSAKRILDEYKERVPANKVGRPKKGETPNKLGMFDTNKIAELHQLKFGK